MSTLALVAGKIKSVKIESLNLNVGNQKHSNFERRGELKGEKRRQTKKQKQTKRNETKQKFLLVQRVSNHFILFIGYLDLC